MTLLSYKTSALAPEVHTVPVPDRLPRDWTWVNWALALAIAPGAALVMIFALGAAKSTTCGALACPYLGPGGSLFNLLYYGAAVVAGVTILASFFTATGSRGAVVPLCGWGLLLADAAVLAATF